MANDDFEKDLKAFGIKHRATAVLVVRESGDTVSYTSDAPGSMQKYIKILQGVLKELRGQ